MFWRMQSGDATSKNGFGSCAESHQPMDERNLFVLLGGGCLTSLKLCYIRAILYLAACTVRLLR